jgi:hypothetical protein
MDLNKVVEIELARIGEIPSVILYLFCWKKILSYQAYPHEYCIKEVFFIDFTFLLFKKYFVSF